MNLWPKKVSCSQWTQRVGPHFPISLEFWCRIRKKAYTWTRVSWRGTSGAVVSMMHSLPGFVLVLKWSFVLLLLDTWWSTYGLTHVHGYHLQLNWSSSACYTSSLSCRENQHLLWKSTCHSLASHSGAAQLLLACTKETALLNFL